MSAKAKQNGRYVCPSNGEITECGDCHAPFSHVVEELVHRGQKVPSCELHGTKLVLVPGSIPAGFVGLVARVRAETEAHKAALA